MKTIVEMLFRAWGSGSWNNVASILDNDVQLLSFYEPGQWDCRGPGEVVAFLAEHDPPPDRAVVDEIDHETLVVSPGCPERTPTSERGTAATVVTVRDGRVVCMQRYRDRSEALAAARA